MGITAKDVAALSPVQKMDLADVLYDVAQQEIEAEPLTEEQLIELDRRLALTAGQGRTT